MRVGIVERNQPAELAHIGAVVVTPNLDRCARAIRCVSWCVLAAPSQQLSLYIADIVEYELPEKITVTGNTVIKSSITGEKTGTF